jgi:hypothetical protein
MVAMSSNKWSLKMLGSFELRDPDGSLVVLSTRKVQRLLAILALSPGHSVTRTELQTELWSDASADKQQASLRQALKMLRKSLGEDAITSTRDRCELSRSFPLECDAAECEMLISRPDLPRPEVEYDEFMPDAFEPWFVRKRARYRQAFSSSSGKGYGDSNLPLLGLLSLMRWYADTDPPKALQLMRDHGHLIQGIPPRELQPVIENAIAGTPPDHPLLGWAFLWRGLCIMNTKDLSAGEVFLRRAFELGKMHGDEALQVEAGANLAAGQIVSGKALAAERTVAMVRGVAEQTRDKYLMSRSYSIAGINLVHQGQVENGLRMMEQAHREIESSTTEHAQLEVLRALFMATAGYSEAALDVLEGPERLASQSGHWNITEISLLTRALIAVREREPDLAIGLLQDLVVRTSSAHSAHLEIYAREALALVTWRKAEKSATVEQLKTSGKLRRALGMGMTEWDRSRLEELAVIE